MYKPNCYLFSRSDIHNWEDWHPVELSNQVFFQMWSKRMFPYSEISEGDVIYIGDMKSRRIYWEVRVSALVKRDNLKNRGAIARVLRNVYGLNATDLNEYYRTSQDFNVLIAWAPRVMAKHDIHLGSFHFGRNGYQKLSAADMKLLKIPSLKSGKALAIPDNEFDVSRENAKTIPNRTRYIPLSVRRAVIVRDQAKCIGCGSRVNLHFDHKLPVARGGGNQLSNIRLLCARSNLAKGVKGPSTKLACLIRKTN